MAVLPRLRPPLDPVRAALRSNSRALAGVAIFSALINLLLLTSPLFMLQVYTRVLTSRSHQTLIALLGVRDLLLVLMAILDQSRASILTQIGLSLDRALREHAFNGVIEQQLLRKTSGDATQVRDLDVVRTFLAGPARSPCSTCRGCRSTSPSASCCIPCLVRLRSPAR